MARPRKVEKTETFDEFVARVIAEHGLPITACTFPGLDMFHKHDIGGFQVKPGEPSARLSNGETVK